ncbi:hypothetical protein [Hyphomicrobium sp.]|uniref:hypothetical protein n=1 Tax=Hyphomicrobium sp. TaxID=82 RepID=UPI001DAC0D03|nr:hypothetical protein [Hyphomicrobium sp.]MBY0561522.1 hypothetical protein [Hyphomicrobium sp.]
MNNDDRDADACLWAKELGLGETLFKSVPLGARFVFDRDHFGKDYAILIKCANGYRHEVGGRIWSTGARTACFVLDNGDA